MFDDAWLSIKQLIEVTKGKKVIFWGCFDFFEKTMREYNFSVDFIVDINVHLHGKAMHHGYDVYAPSVLADLYNKQDYYVIVSSSAFYEIFPQLIDYGFSSGKEFSAAPMLKNLKVIDDFNYINGNVIFSSSDAVRDSLSCGGGLYSMDLRTGKIQKKVSGVCRGFDLCDGFLYLADADKGIRVLDNDFDDVDCIALPEGAYPHGMSIDQLNKKLYLVLTRFDQIYVYDLKNNEYLGEISISNKFARSGGVYYNHHINDICINDAGDGLYVSMFSKSGNVQAGWQDGAVIEYDLIDKKIIGDMASGLWMPHSARILNGTFSFLDSMRGDLYVSSHDVETHFNGFVRGVDYDGKYYYVGQSTHRYFDLMDGVSNNISVDSGVHIYDPVSKATKFVQANHIKDINTLRVAH